MSGMLLAVFRPWFERCARLCANVDRLIAEHGRIAAGVARRKAFAVMRQKGDRADDEWSVVQLVKRRLGIYRQPDTATRWLER
ncbi:hypothetical protein [Palleronia aestuarii]|uniref:hypothetical protein n=1 Tax=Palleronia aestuarii TaxID=568105 RepID=UPI0011B505AB|nr:hypothetical protein [Palleronia aestuarii]